MTPTLKTGYNHLTIYFDGVVHLKLKLSELVGIQAWHQSNIYHIEFALKSNEIKVEYNTKEKWLAVLKLIDEMEFK